MWPIVIFVTTLLWSNAFTETCVSPLGATSECVSIYNCPQFLSALEQRPVPTSVVSYLRKSQCGFKGNEPQVCCGPVPSGQENTITPTQNSHTDNTTNVEGAGDNYSSEDSSLAPASQCGIDTNGGRIYGGQLTELDEFPWLARMGYRTRNGSIAYQCGGSLLNHRYVLTAAHCITGAIKQQIGTLVTVRLGEYDLQNDVDCVDGVCADKPQDIPVHSAYPHPGYSDNNRNRKDDIGIARLASRASFSYYVQPICLVSAKERLVPGYEVVVSGWGKTLKDTNSSIKLKVNMPIFDKDECAAKYRSLGAELTDNQICAGGAVDESACKGDSGGPLMRRRPDGIWEAVGLVSFGNGCGKKGWPGVSTSIASYRDWIESTLQSTNVIRV